MRKKSAESLCNVNRLLVNSLLAARDLTASDLAQALGISPQYMSDMLKGRRNAKAYIPLIAKFLDVSERRITIHVPSSSSSTQTEAHAVAPTSPQGEEEHTSFGQSQ